MGAQNFFSETIDDALSTRLDSAQQYRNASSVAPWTIPSVASVLTGLYPLQHNAGLFDKQPANLSVDLPSALNESAVTLADILTEQQFRTAVFSAHPWITAKFGLAQGFENLHSRKGWQKVTEKSRDWLDQVIEPSPVQANNEVQAIEQPAGQAKEAEPAPRFFAYLHFMEAHDWHLKNPEELQKRLAGVDPELRELLLEDSSEAACIDDENSEICLRNQVYNLAVRELRTAIADILQGLEDRDLLKNTLVMVYSDHGEEFWQHKTQHEKLTDPRGIYGFGHGHSLYEEMLHIPLVAWHPGIKGAVRSDLVSLIDVLPSALNWLGIEAPENQLPGMPLPAGTDGQRETEDPRVVYASGIAYGPEGIAVREGQLKSIMRFPDEDFQYFDLSRDPMELRPTKSDRLTMRFDTLTGDYIDMKKESIAFRPEVDEQTLEHLKSIGYLQGVEEQPDREPDKATSTGPDETPDTPDREDSPEQ